MFAQIRCKAALINPFAAFINYHVLNRTDASTFVQNSTQMKTLFTTIISYFAIATVAFSQVYDHQSVLIQDIQDQRHDVMYTANGSRYIMYTPRISGTFYAVVVANANNPLSPTPISVLNIGMHYTQAYEMKSFENSNQIGLVFASQTPSFQYGTTPTHSSTGGQEAYAVVMDTLGNALWSAKYGTPSANDVPIDFTMPNSNSLVMAGIEYAFPNRAFISTHNPNGLVQSATYIADSTNFNIASGFTGILPTSNSHEYIVSGYAGNSGLIARIVDSTAAEIWSTKNTIVSNSGSCVMGDVVEDEDGNYYACGNFVDSLTIDGNLIVAPGRTAFIVKLDPMGNIEWYKHFPSITGTEGSVQSLEWSECNGLMAAGIFQRDIVIDGTTYASTQNVFGVYNSFVINMDTDGNILWSDALIPTNGSFAINNIAIHEDGRAMFSADFDEKTNGAGALLYFANGDSIQHSQLNGTVFMEAIGTDIPSDLSLSYDSLTHASASGTTVGLLDYQDCDEIDQDLSFEFVAGQGDDDNTSFTLSGNELKSAFTADYSTKNSYTVRIKTTDMEGFSTEAAFNIYVTEGGPIDTTTGIEPMIKSTALSLYPNPAYDHIIVKSKDAMANAEVINIHGQTVQKIRLTASETKVDLSMLSKGVYFIRANQEIARFIHH